MANVENRPYAGTWQMNQRRVVKYTPDALVFVNGDTSLPGCPRCRGRIDLQRHVTSLSIEAGTQIGAHSATIQLSLPRVQGQQVFIDGYNILRPGLEVHIFLRGYFPIRGMFTHLPDPQTEQGTPAFPNATGADKLDMSKYAAYPYYPAFHGVVTNVSYEYSGGFYTGTISCASLLHFWSFANVVTSGAQLGGNKKALNDLGRTLQGHNFNNMHPHAIIYTLYRDVAAAGAVEFALSEQSNLDALGGTGEFSLFQQVTKYWEQRFRTRIQSLRMYGVNGNLFNAAQQAWIGTAATRDVKRLLTSPAANDPDTHRATKGIFSARRSVAKALGLQDRGADFIFSPLLQQNGDVANFSLLNLFAFTQDLSQVGEVNLYQSTYQTKADVANQVTAITGFEFYQDVDGDLVFKPPFWNLDTSSNRYYRLESHDIINFSVTETEPQATYIIVRGQWIEGITGVVSNTGVLNKRGVHVDWKLVAQFGWRPAATMEITTYVDPKVLFYIGVARLDMLNVATNSASVTIPIRPELRPGYPVYIPPIDCYYYITQLSHQFAFGGACTTSLVLTCRRRKWHAPGVLGAPPQGKSGIDLIRLDRPDLAPRPLEIFDNGIPRVVGFPNVVMALDPQKFNPNFSVVGAGLEYFASLANGQTSADQLAEMIRQDADNLNAFEVVTEIERDGKVVKVSTEESDTFRLRYGKNLAETITFTTAQLARAFTDYQAASQTVAKLEKQELSATIRERQATTQANSKVGSGTNAGAIGRLYSTQQQLADARQKVSSFLGETSSGDPSSGELLTLIFDALQPVGNRPLRAKIDGVAESDVTYSWFEALTHLKGQYTAAAVPGSYRYYSCAHPVEQMQGQPVIKWSDGKKGKKRRTRAPGAVRTQDTAAPVSSALDQRRRFLDEQDALQARLDDLGVTFVGAGQLLSARNNGSTLHTDLSPQEVKDTPLTEDISQNLANISQMGQELVNRLNARDDFGGAGYSLVQTSSWRVGSEVEGSQRRSQHTLGLAMDLGIRGGPTTPVGKATKNEDLPGTLPAAWQAVKDEASTMFAEGLISGFGFYEERIASQNRNRPFVHIDVREGAPQRWAEVQGVSSYTRDAKITKSCQIAYAAGNVSSVDACVAAATGLRDDAASRSRAQQQRSIDQGAPDRRRTQSNSVGHPVNAPGVPKAPTAATGTKQPAQDTTEPREGPSITTQEHAADTSRLVVQFRPTVTKPDPALRAPEAELGVGPCRRGIQVLQVRTKQKDGQTSPDTQVLTTDQIQTLMFTRHEAGKFAQVVGTSQTSGRLTFNATNLGNGVTEKFRVSAQDLDDPTQTPEDIWLDLYNQIKADLESVEVPFYENGDLVLLDTIDIPEFDEILVVTIEAIPAGLLPTLQQQFGSHPSYALANFSFQNVAQFPRFRPSGAQKDDGQSWRRAVDVAAAVYGDALTTRVQAFFNKSLNSALEPTTGKTERLGEIENAFSEMIAKAVGVEESVGMVLETQFVEKTIKEGEITKAIQTPVIPVSDDRGYEHYGMFRYGRGLSVEPGGTFEFLNSGTDPFNNVTAETAEIFLRYLTLRQQGKVSTNSNTLAGRQQALAAVQQALLQQNQAVLGQTATVSQEQVQVATGALDNASAVGNALLADPNAGRSALQNLLRASGDDPNLIDQATFDLADTQFGRNFANWAVNYGKTDVFRTTVSNAAYRLADLTDHLLARAGKMCICRGSYSDVALAAYARESFVAVEGIDQQEDKATAYHSEEIIKAAEEHSFQQRRYRGAVLEGAQPDAKAFDRVGGGQPNAAAPLGASGSLEETPEGEPVNAENPPTTFRPEGT